MTEPIPAAEEPSASAWQLLRQPAFSRYFAGSFISNVGTWFQDIAAAIVIYQLTGSAVLVAGLAICAHGSSLLLSPLGGQLADRFDRRRLLVIMHLVQGAAAAMLAILSILGIADLWTIFAVALVIGVGRAVNNPTLQAMLPALVRPRDFAQATALLALTFNLARVIGPILGALLVATAGAGPSFAVNSASFFIFVALLLSLRISPRAISKRPGGFREGLRYVRDRPRLLVLLVCCTLIGMSTDPVITLGPALAVSFGEDESVAGWFVAVFGLGAVLGAPLVGIVRERLGQRRTGVVSLVVIAVAFGGVTVSGALAPALVLFAIAGFAFLIGNSDLLAGIQEGVDDDVRGRVMALWSMGFVGSRPLAAVFDGAVADISTPATAVGALGALILVVTAFAAIAFRGLERPLPG